MISQLKKHVERFPDKIVFIYLENGENIERKVSFFELLENVKCLGSQLYNRELEGKRALLVYQDTLEFAISFLACQYAGVVAVPIYFAKGERQIVKIANIINDAAVSAILTTSNLQLPVEKILSSHNLGNIIENVFTTDILRSTVASPTLELESPNTIAFIQYTSGSTGIPKGVIISKKNLISNQEVIIRAFGCNESSVILSWLPFQHDMGLIGNILQAVYVGCLCVQMSPFHFIQKPVRWLKAISKYQVTHSGAPNFAYDLCVDKIQLAEVQELSLSSWRLAFNGSEPVRYNTMLRFSQRFKTIGFTFNSFYPCYGLAEATLMVSGYKKFAPPLTIYVDRNELLDGKISLSPEFNTDVQPIVSSGAIVEGVVLKILDKETGKFCDDLVQGEICVSGDSVAQGYWNKPKIIDFIKIDEREFFRTGDLGFLLGNELFVSGRLKELIIIKGQNYYPYDIEEAVAECDSSLEKNGVSVFAFNDEIEKLVVAAEIKRTMVNNLAAENVIRSIEQKVMDAFGLEIHDVVLVMPFSVPRTTSGKLQRLKCKEFYMQEKFQTIASKANLMASEPDDNNNVLIEKIMRYRSQEDIFLYLIKILNSRKTVSENISPSLDVELTSLGVNSLLMMEVVNTVNRDFNILIDAAVVFQENSLHSLLNMIETMLWIKYSETSGDEIII